MKALLILGMPVLASAAFNYWDPKDTTTVPTTLSATGLYTNITAVKKTMLANVYHFEVNTALWSDGSHKTRWFMLKPGTQIGFDMLGDYWDYPDSAMFIKQFAIDTVPGDSTSRVLYETRFLYNVEDTVTLNKKFYRMDQWYGYSYRWNEDQKDAVLIRSRGKDDTIHQRTSKTAATYTLKKWHFPGRSQCDQCHRVSYADTVHGRSVLGFFTAQLNRPHPDTANINQLEYFFKHNQLKGTKAPDWNAASVPRWRGIDESTFTVDLRARSYIAANCSGCHGRRGIATGATFGVELNYDFFTMQSKLEFRHQHVTYAFGLDTVQPLYYPKNDPNNPAKYDSMLIEPALVVPTYPTKSVILFRQRVRNTRPADWDGERNQMPPIASYEVNVPATALIERWIKEMPVIPPENWNGIRNFAARTKLTGPSIQGNLVTIPLELAGPGQVRVSITGITGRSQDLNQTGRATYALPSGITPGVYVIRVGKTNFTRYLF